MNYNNLIQSKRSKMLCLVLLLLLYPFLNVAGINLTYIVKKNDNVLYPSCIAEDLERYEGIGWVYPIPKGPQSLPTVVTKFIPTIKNYLNCKFTRKDACNELWALRDWQIDIDSEKTKDVITDTRWDDLPTMLIYDPNEFRKKIDFDNTNKLALSVRADGYVEIFLCSGWNPRDYPCFYFFINHTDIYLNQYPQVPKDVIVDVKKNYVEHSKASLNILSKDEWRTFVLNWNESGLVQLIDFNLNRILIEHTFQEPLNPKHLLMRSGNSSLWKLHQNSFMYTTTAQISRLGPMLEIPSKDLCVSMFVKVCSYCEMKIFYLNKTRKILKVVTPTKNEEWIQIKLKEENIPFDKVNLFVETNFLNTAPNGTQGFWAIDNVRVCHENEVKVSYLNLNGISENVSDHVSCQLIKKPSWRPKKLVYNEIKDLPEVYHTSTPNSIRLKWASEDSENPITYFIFYQGNDICPTEPHNSKRFKSSGFISTRSSDITINDLVPFTDYNITISTDLHETDKQLVANTLETAEPNLEEMPANIQLKALDTSINVTWEQVDCYKKYGRLVYTVIVANATLNFSKELSIQTNTSYVIDGLQPYTHYTLTILTARNGRSLHNRVNMSKFSLNFMTMAGVSPAPEHLEVYSMDKNSASLRYDLPPNANGVIKKIQVSRCNSLSYHKCKTDIKDVRTCSLWPHKHCVEVDYLQPFQSYTFRVSLKNRDTPTFGKEVKVRGFAAERIPGRPTTVQYKTVDCHPNKDYCHLNVTWLHPYDQNGTITHFDIVFNSSDVRKDSENDMVIQEAYNITNKTYYYEYTYQIKYLPFSRRYMLYIRSGNAEYKSKFMQVGITTDNLGAHINQRPKLMAKSQSTLLFKMPHLDSRLDFYNLTVVVQDYDKDKKVDGEILKNRKIADHLCNNYGDTWISQVIKVDSNKTENIMIGNAEKEKLKPNTKYCVIFIVTNQYKGAPHDIIYYDKIYTSPAQTVTKEAASSFNHLYLLFLILLLIPIGFLIYRYFRKKRYIKESMIPANEHCYETLPCDEIQQKNSDSKEKLQVVSNKNYT